MTDGPFLPIPGSFAVIQGADTPEEARLIGEWLAANNVDPAAVDGHLGVRADYAGQQLIWFDRVTERRTAAPMLVEPPATVLGTGRSRRDEENW